MKKIIAIILAAVLVLSFAACKKTDKNPDTTAAADAQTSEQAGDVTGEETASTDETSSETEIVIDKEGHTVVETDAVKPSESKTPSGGSTVTPSKDLNTNDAAACIKAYQAAIAKTKQFKSGRQNMSLKGEITASGFLGAIFNVAQKSIANALSKNSKDRTDIPGNPSGMKASHMKSASAVTSGIYTTITFNVKDQTQDGKIELTYTNCKVVVKIDNTTGKVVEGSWVYDVNVYANGIKVSGVSVNNLKGIVAFSYTAKG